MHNDPGNSLYFTMGPPTPGFLSSFFRLSMCRSRVSQTCLGTNVPWPGQVCFFRTIFGGNGGGPDSMVPLHNLRRVTSHVLHQDVPLGGTKLEYVSFEFLFAHS